MPQQRFVYQLTVRTTIRVIAGVSIGLGADMAAAGPSRFAVPALATAALIPGGVYTWAALITTGGLLTLAGTVRWRRPIVMAGLAWMGVWFGFFDAALWSSRFSEPSSPVTGCWVYLLLAAICAVLYSGGHELHQLDKGRM